MNAEESTWKASSESARFFGRDNLLVSMRSLPRNDDARFELKGQTFYPSPGTVIGRLTSQGLTKRSPTAIGCELSAARFGYVRYLDDFPVTPLNESLERYAD